MYCTKAVHETVKSDLNHVFKFFPTECLLHLKNNRHRLIRGCYKWGENGCMFFLLSEPLPASKRIESREALTRYFTDGRGATSQECDARPAEALVDAVDGRTDEIPRNRYGDLEELDWDVVFEVLGEELNSRNAVEVDCQAVG